jgi:hypothetical protein
MASTVPNIYAPVPAPRLASLDSTCTLKIRTAILEDGMSLRELDILPGHLKYSILEKLRKPDIISWRTKMYSVQAELLLENADDFWTEWFNYYGDEWVEMLYIKSPDLDEPYCLYPFDNDDKHYAYIEVARKYLLLV